MTGFFSALAALAAATLAALLFLAPPAIEAATPNVGTVWAPGTVAYIPCGGNINAMTASTGNGGSGAYGNGAGVIFQLAGAPGSPCTYSGQTFHTQSNETIEGDCSSPLGADTILDGMQGGPTTTNTEVTDGLADAATGVTLKCLTIKNYAGAKACPGPGGSSSPSPGCGFGLSTTSENGYPTMNTWDGWVLANDTIRDSGGTGVYIHGSTTIENSLLTYNGHSAFVIVTSSGSNMSPVNIIGNEISYNNQGNGNPYYDVGQKYLNVNSFTQSVNELYNYVHDNNSIALWCDTCNNLATGEWRVEGNTIFNNGVEGVRCETSSYCIISHNVIGPNNRAKGYSSGSESGGGEAYEVAIVDGNASGIGNSEVVENNITVSAVNPTGVAAFFDGRNSAPVGDTLKNNTVSFEGGSGAGQYGITGSGSGNSSNLNAFYLQNLTDAHFQWAANSTLVSLPSYQATNGEDAQSLAYAGSATAAGCRHAGCSGDPLPLSSLVGGSPSGSITDLQGHLWTVAGGQIYRDGTVDPVTRGVILFLYYDYQVFQENSFGLWYQLASAAWPAGGSGWQSIVGDPRIFP